MKNGLEKKKTESKESIHNPVALFLVREAYNSQRNGGNESKWSCAFAANILGIEKTKLNDYQWEGLLEPLLYPETEKV